MNPTREQFELAARAAGHELVWGGKYSVGGDIVDCTDIPYLKSDQPDEADTYWEPHLPGIDNAMLAAALWVDQEWTNLYAWASDNRSVQKQQTYADLPGTETERRARAMAWATFLVAVEIGRGMK